MDIIVIDYCRDYPEGLERLINSDHIVKFYATYEDMKYIIGSGDDWFKISKNKRLMKRGKLFKMWDEESERHVGYVKSDCHPVMIEVEYASPTHIYDGSTYIQYYWSDTSLEEFTATHGKEKRIEEVFTPIESRFELMIFEE